MPAAFFVTLPYLKSAPEVASRVILEGHVVGNHSDTHPKFSTISRTQMAKEIEKYLSTGIIHGIGPVTAKKIVNKFGDKTDFQINIKKILDNNDRE